jgi:hypothetical protein
LTVTIHVYNFAQVDGRVLRDAEEVATEIFRKAGVETRWVDFVSASENMQSHLAVHGSYNLSAIQLDFLPSLRAERLGLPNNVMGLAPGTGLDRQLVYVLYDKVEALAEIQMSARAGGCNSTYGIRVQILGYAIAHEIGHILLNLESHSDSGIMRADWDLRQLQDACYGYLVFTPPQAEAIRLEVARRSGQQATLEATNGNGSHVNQENPTPDAAPVNYLVNRIHR